MAKKKINKKEVKIVKKDWIYWVPRVLSILFLLFLALFSLDVFEMCKSFFECSLALLIHNIPVIILAMLLVLAWKKEIIGAITFILAGLAYTSLILINIIRTGFEWYYLAWALQISGVAIFIGILFWIGWKRRK